MLVNSPEWHRKGRPLSTVAREVTGTCGDESRPCIIFALSKWYAVKGSRHMHRQHGLTPWCYGGRAPVNADELLEVETVSFSEPVNTLEEFCARWDDMYAKLVARVGF